jgi:hypothetical protein
MKVTVWSFVGILALTTAMNCHAAAKVEEQVLGPKVQNLSYYSPNTNGTHFVQLVPKGSRTTVWYDGVEGPVFDEILRKPLGSQDAYGSRIVFSPDGAHYAYVGRQGDEYVVMRDGKEVARGAYAAGMFDAGLFYSPGSKHLCYEMNDHAGAAGGGCVWLYVDGKRWACVPGTLAFSRDDAHYAFTGAKSGSQDVRAGQTLVVDGKDAGYLGKYPQFTAKNQVVCVGTDAKGNPQAVFLDGKPVGQTSSAIPIVLDPTGTHFAFVAGGTLVMDGKPVPGADGIAGDSFAWSPDGKHYAFRVQTPANKYRMVIDGKKGQDYDLISQFTFTPDSAKAIYTAQANGQWFLVTNGEESQLYYGNPLLVLNATGSRLAFVATVGFGQQTVVVDGKPLPTPHKSITDLAFSPDSSRYAGCADGRLIVDGEEQAGVLVGSFTVAIARDARRFLFSPDGKHIAVVGQTKKRRGMFVDGQFIPGQGKGDASEYTRVSFTPDSQHLVWVETVKGQHHIYVDGKEAAPMDLPGDVTTKVCFDVTPGLWAMGSDGIYTIVGLTRDTVKRLRVTPGSDTSVTTMLADAKAAVAEMDAEAAAKKPASKKR